MNRMAILPRHFYLKKNDLTTRSVHNASKRQKPFFEAELSDSSRDRCASALNETLRLPAASRRAALQDLAAASFLNLAALPALGDDEAPRTLRVGQGSGEFASITAALESAAPRDTIVVGTGSYSERLLFSKPVTLAAASGAQVQVSWVTDTPYESTVEIACDGVALDGLQISHSSKSVANNYAVRLVGCDAVLRDCRMTSATGAGVGIEGGAPRLQRCAVVGCARQGISVFGDAETALCTAEVSGCKISDNARSGILVRAGAEPSISNNILRGNGGFGLELLDCGGTYRENTVSGNALGAVGCGLLYDPGLKKALKVDNYLQGAIVALNPGKAKRR